MVQGQSGDTEQKWDKTTWKVRKVGLGTAKTQPNKTPNPNLPAAPAEQAALRERKILLLCNGL